MKIGLSLLSKFKSLIGIEIGYGAYLKQDNDGVLIIVRTVEINIGFIFGWITISFDNGVERRMDEINESIKQTISKGKKIGTNG